MGFLATVDREDARLGCIRALNGDFEVLSLPGINLSGARGQWIAINDVSIHRQQGKRVADLEYAVSGDEVGRVRCDGLVVATPAGSTGYNLANGGPVMAWGVHGYVVSFIAPHSLTARTLVVAPDDELVVHNRSQEEPVDVIVDAGRSACWSRVKRCRRASRTASGPSPRFPARPSISACGRSSGGSRRRSDRQRGRAVTSGPAGRPLGMLHELRVENLLLMERAELRLAPGLNLLTGETGAGKTLLAHALDLLLGGRARHGIVRDGAEEAYVEGVFALPPALAGSDRLPSGADEVVLARRVWPDGRTRAYVCGRSATVADLQELGGQLLAFYASTSTAS